MRVNKLSLWLLLWCLPWSVFAANEDETHYNRIHLNAAASGKIENDTLRAILGTQEEGMDTTALAEKVNRKIQWAIAEIKKHTALKVQTQSYTTSPVYYKNKITHWRVSQAIQVESQDLALVSQVLGQLQTKLNLQGIQFIVSPAARSNFEASLISQALDAFKQRANAVTRHLGFKQYHIVDLRIGSSGGAPIYQARSMAMAEAMPAPPPLEAGESSMSVSINAEIELY